MSFFSKPYPFYPFSAKDVLKQFLVASFIAFFLIIFQPFDINIWQTSHKILKLLAFGLISFLIPFFIKASLWLVKIDEEKWTVGKEILFVIFVLICVASGNLFLAWIISLANISWGSFMAAFVVTVLVAIFPLTFGIAYKHNRFLKLNQREAEIMETHLHDFQKKTEKTIENETQQIPRKIILLAENEKETFEFFPEQLLFIESADNYSNVVYHESGKIKKQLIRSSLKRMEQQIKHPYILRCHRSYVVNLLNINRAQGNAQGYRINFKFPDTGNIPVSRNYSTSLLDRLNSLK